MNRASSFGQTWTKILPRTPATSRSTAPVSAAVAIGVAPSLSVMRTPPPTARPGHGPNSSRTVAAALSLPPAAWPRAAATLPGGAAEATPNSRSTAGAGAGAGSAGARRGSERRAASARAPQRRDPIASRPAPASVGRARSRAGDAGPAAAAAGRCGGGDPASACAGRGSLRGPQVRVAASPPGESAGAITVATQAETARSRRRRRPRRASRPRRARRASPAVPLPPPRPPRAPLRRAVAPRRRVGDPRERPAPGRSAQRGSPPAAQRRRAEVVEVAGEPADEPRALAAVREVRASLALGLGVGEPGRVRLQHRRSGPRTTRRARSCAASRRARRRPRVTSLR